MMLVCLVMSPEKSHSLLIGIDSYDQGAKELGNGTMVQGGMV